MNVNNVTCYLWPMVLGLVALVTGLLWLNQEIQKSLTIKLGLAAYFQVFLEVEFGEVILQMDSKVHVLHRVDHNVDELHTGHLTHTCNRLMIWTSLIWIIGGRWRTKKSILSSSFLKCSISFSKRIDSEHTCNKSNTFTSLYHTTLQSLLFVFVHQRVCTDVHIDFELDVI